ncbi:hypothetical protein E8E13_001877 [Curvularia kusanoi]|uniref:NAD-dependent epimerase/dehydratase domain-containing protein n=1 Tax=Curvularia kusanoi TaxID=90978 RepID=A0A9P4T6E8_CURKU|nr:hypothetical protein E8E13_001877 [Curvularia kusanoi]
MPPKLFLTGGSGYIGSTLIPLFLSHSYTITALSRTPSSDSKLLSLGATPIRGSLTSLSVLSSCARDADIVISIADAKSGDLALDNEERMRINEAANDALAEGLAAGKTDGERALVLTSGTLVAASDPEGKETDETSPGWPEGHWAAFELGRMKKEYLEAGIRVCQVRLAPWVYGRGGSGVGLFMGIWKSEGEGMVVQGGEVGTTAVHVDDVVELYLRVTERGRTGESYNASAQTDVTQRQLAEAICKAISVPCKSLAFEEAVGKVGPFLAGFLSVGNKASSRKAREELGWETRGPGILEEIEQGSYVEVAKALEVGGV